MKPTETAAILACVLAAICIFLPAIMFDLLFPGVRTTQLEFSDLQMWSFWLGTFTGEYGVDSADLLARVKFYAFQGLSILAPVVAAFLLIRYTRKQTSGMMESQTSATWAPFADLKEYIGDDGLLLSKKLRLRQMTCYGHCLVIGPTGSGKTVSFFLPNIMLMPPTYSMVITDPKGELYQQTAAWQMKQGRRVALIKLDNMYVSESWNPLDFPTDSVMMSKICASVVKNKGGDSGGGGGDQDFWDATAIDLLMALVYIVRAIPPGTYGTFRNAYHILAANSFESMIGLAKFAVAETGVKDILSRASSFSSAVAPEETRNSTRFVLKTALSPFNDDQMAYITAITSIDFAELKQEPVALYVSMPEHKVAGATAVLSTLYMQIFDSLLECGGGGRPVFFLLDEFANIGKIIGFAQYIATIRSRNLSVSVCLQSGEQLTRNYSEAEKQEITNNLKTMAVMPGLKEEKTLQYIQTVAGKISGYDRSSNKEDKRVFTKDRLPITAIREMEDNPITGDHEVIVMLPNKPPFKDKQRRSYSDPQIKKIMDENPPIDFTTRDQSVFDNIRANCFLEPGDLHLLELIGTYINYEGKISKIEDDKRLATLKQFEELANLCGTPTIDTKTGEIIITWPEKKVLPARGALARVMIEKAFKWLIENGMMTP